MTPDAAGLLDRLSANPWFGSLPLAERRRIVAACERRTLVTGEMLFRQGDAPGAAAGAFYGVVAGALKASSLRGDGREAILAILEPGTWFGELSLLDGRPRTHDAVALEPSEIAWLPAAAFHAAMERPAFAQGIARLLAGRVRSLYGIVEDAALRSTRARVARRLLLLARGDAALAADARPVLPVSQEALAMMLGITRQTLSRELGALAEAGALALGYRRIEVRDVARLQALATDG